jgi:mutator protein MutT
MRQIDVAIAIILRPTDGRVLVCQRKSGDTFGGFWEFPGGKQEPGETIEQCLSRELREEICVSAKIIHRFRSIEHAYPQSLVRLHPFLCHHENGDVQLIECQDARWIEVADLRTYQFPPANEVLIEEIIAHVPTAATPRVARCSLPEDIP